MSDVSVLLARIQSGEPAAAEQLLPLVYQELRGLAAARLAHEAPGQTLQATALVHEAYLRLVGNDGERDFAGRQHFFRAAAEAMRRILVDQARRKATLRHGGPWQRLADMREVADDEVDLARTLAIHELLDRLAASHPRSAEVAKMRCYLQMTFVEMAEALGVSADTAETEWAFARAWLKRAWQAES